MWWGLSLFTPCCCYSQTDCGNGNQHCQASLPPAWQHQHQNSPFWTINHIPIPDQVCEVKERSSALIGQGEVTYSLMEPIRNLPQPTLWTEYEGRVVLQGTGGAAARVRGNGSWQGKITSCLPPHSSQLLLRRHLPDPHLQPGGSLQPLRLSAGHSSTRWGPQLHLFPEPAAPPSCPAVSPGFKLNTFVLPHTSMSHQVPGTIDSASPGSYPPQPPCFGRTLACSHILLRTAAHSLSQPLLPDPAPSHSASISLLCSKMLSGPILPKNLAPNFLAWHSETSPYDSPLLQPPCSVSPLHAPGKQHLALCPPGLHHMPPPSPLPGTLSPQHSALEPHAVEFFPTTLAFWSNPSSNTYLLHNLGQVH